MRIWNPSCPTGPALCSGPCRQCLGQSKRRFSRRGTQGTKDKTGGRFRNFADRRLDMLRLGGAAHSVGAVAREGRDDKTSLAAIVPLRQGTAICLLRARSRDNDNFFARGRCSTAGSWDADDLQCLRRLPCVVLDAAGHPWKTIRHPLYNLSLIHISEPT